MNILVLNGSPRKKGDTAKLIDAFSKGVEKSSHVLSVLNIGTMNIKGCLACEYCHIKEEKNVFKRMICRKSRDLF